MEPASASAVSRAPHRAGDHHIRAESLLLPSGAERLRLPPSNIREAGASLQAADDHVDIGMSFAMADEHRA